MKKFTATYLTGAFVLLASIGQAQQTSEMKYSLGVKVYSFTQMPKNLNETNAQSYDENIARTVFLKFNDNQLSYRLSGTYISENIIFANQCSGCQVGDGNMVDYSFKAGFEKNFNYARIQPYVGFDIGYRSRSFSGVVKNVQQGAPQTAYNVETTKTGAVFTPLLGLKVRVIPEVTLFAEGNLDFFYAYERRETVDQAAGSPTVFNRFTRMEYLLNPVSVGFSINIGRQN